MSNKLILGSAQFGLNYGINNNFGIPSAKELSKILDYSYENNIRIIDSAEIYGDCHMRLGKYHKLSKNKFEIISKLNPKITVNSNDIVNRIKKNISDLNVEYLYAYLFHSYNDFIKNKDELMHSLLELKKSGLIKKIGVSLHSNNEISSLLNHSHIDLIQLPFNLLDNNFQRQKILRKIKSKKIEIHTRSVFFQGLFFKKIDYLPMNLFPLKKYLEKINELFSDKSLLNSFCLNYVTDKEDIDKVIIGVDSFLQLKSNINSLNPNYFCDYYALIDKINVVEKELLNPSNWKN